jgi:hypothetical protein
MAQNHVKIVLFQGWPKEQLYFLELKNIGIKNFKEKKGSV